VNTAAGVTAIPARRAHTREREDNYNDQFNVNLQYQVSPNMSVQVGYIGNRVRNIDVLYPVNLINPATGVRPDTRYSQISVVEPLAEGEFNGLNIIVNRRLSGGLSFNSSYTYSTNRDNAANPQNPARLDLEWARAALDVPHNFTANAIWELPFGSGRRFLNTFEGLTGKLLEGWQLNGIATARSGLPVTVLLGGASQVATGWNTNQRPDRVPGVDSEGPREGVNDWLNIGAFAVPAVGSYGNLERNSERGPKFVQIDMSLFKNTAFANGHALQFRVEVFNVLNEAILAQPTATFRAPATFGRIFNTFGRTESAGTARQIQIGLRYQF
jgi:hypothetical protein